jgi:hypothetical protein
MPNTNQEQLINSLVTSHSSIQNTIKGVDLEIVVYDDPPWQIRDVLWHIAIWDRQVTKSILAFNNGSEYSIPDFNEDDFNNEAYHDGRKLTIEQLLEESDQARTGFRNAVHELPFEKYASEFLYPWGDESGDITKLVGYMVEHDEEHQAEMKTALTSA